MINKRNPLLRWSGTCSSDVSQYPSIYLLLLLLTMCTLLLRSFHQLLDFPRGSAADLHLQVIDLPLGKFGLIPPACCVN
jgi:hypothetical protein